VHSCSTVRLVRILGVPIDPPQDVVARIMSDLGALAGLARSAPAQLDRLLALGDEVTAIGRGVLALGARLDQRAGEITALGERLDVRTAELLELGTSISALGDRIDTRGQEIVERADQVVQTGNAVVDALPTLERALELATPLEGAIDRVGRFVDRLPGGTGARRPGPGGPLDRR
jgi:hypothetical protein